MWFTVVERITWQVCWLMVNLANVRDLDHWTETDRNSLGIPDIYTIYDFREVYILLNREIYQVLRSKVNAANYVTKALNRLTRRIQ